MRFVSCVMLLAGLLAASPGDAAIFTVGADAACTHSSVLSAIFASAGNGPASDEIRVANNQSYSGVIAPIASQNLRVRGGYSDCADSAPSGRTVIVGTTSGSNGTFATSGAADDYDLILENLELRDAGAVARRGGAVRIEGNFNVDLRNSLITNNLAGRGGGVYIDGSDGAELWIRPDSIISNNTATVSGGGIFCQNGGYVILFQALIIGNVAEDGSSDPAESGNGGGVALYGCRLVQYESPGFRGVLANTAHRYGGGYYLRNEPGDGAWLSLFGNAISPAEVTDNEAAVSGGGIAVNDDLALGATATSAVMIHDSWIDSNRAPTGAGISLIAGGDVVMQRTLDTAQCHDATYCSSLSFNGSTSAGATCFGAAAFLGPGSKLRLNNTLVEDNCASDIGWTFRQRADSELQLDSSVVAGNGGSSPFFIETAFTGLLEIAWSTVTGNLDTGHIHFMIVPSGSANTGTLRIHGSLLGEPFEQMVGASGGGGLPPMTLEFDCLVVDTFFVSPLSAIRATELSPPYGMIAPASGNYRLSSGNAIPVDWCDASLGARANGDAHGVTAVYDAPRANTHGPFDLGAYEFVVALPDMLFANGFE